MRVLTAACWNPNACARSRITGAADDRSYCSCADSARRASSGLTPRTQKLVGCQRSVHSTWRAAAHVPHSPRRISRAPICSPRALGRGISRPPQRVLVPTPLPWSSAVRAAARRLPLALRTRMSGAASVRPAIRAHRGAYAAARD